MCKFKSKENNIQRQIHHDSPSGCYERLKWYEISFFGGVVAAVVVGGFTFFTNLQSSSSSKPFFFLKGTAPLARNTHTLCLFSLFLSLSPSLCSHATVIQSELVEIHMHAFQKGWGGW